MKVQKMETSFKHYFSLNFKLLSMMSLTCALNTNKRGSIFIFLEKLRTYLSNLHGMIVVVLEVSLIKEALPHNVPLVTKIASQLISNIQCIGKGFRLASTTAQTEEVYKRIEIIWNQQLPSNTNNRMRILNEAGKTLFFCKCYCVVMMSCIVFHDIPPLTTFLIQYYHRNAINHTYDYSRRVILVNYPFEVNSTPIFLFVCFHEGYLLIISGLFWVTSDTLFAQFITHVCLQFKILKDDIETLINEEKIQEKLRTNIIVFVNRHRELLRICELIENIYSPVIFITMLLSALNICGSLFEVRETISRHQYEETANYFSLVMITFFQILFFCTFAETVTDQSSSIADSIYNCQWIEKDPKFRFYLHLIIQRSQVPFRCTAYGFFPIGHKQLSSIITTSMSYYMMMETMK